MKKLLGLGGLLLLLTVGVWGQTYTWNGSVSTDWNNASNWIDGSPGDGNGTADIIIQNTTNNPLFNPISAAGLICNSLTISLSASLNMGTYDLNVSNTFTNNGNLILAGVSGQTVSAGNIAANETVTYNAAVPANGVNFAGLNSFNNLTVQNGARTGAGAITVNGAFRLEAGSINAATMYVSNANGTSYISGNITTTSDGTGTNTHRYQGAVTLNGTITLQGNGISNNTIRFNSAVTLNSGANVTLTGAGTNTNVRFGNTVNGAGSITVNNANARFSNSVGAATSLTSINVTLAGATTRIGGSIRTTGNQNYAGVVQLDANNITLDGGTSSINFGGNITNNGTTRPLTVTAANVVFNGTTNSAITNLNVTGNTAINANITTTGTQTYQTVTLGGTGTVRTLTGSTVTLGTITGAGQSLTITGNGVLNGGSGINNLSVSGTSTINGDINTSGTQTYTQAVTLGGTGGRTLTGATVTLGTITGAGRSLTITGNVVLNGGSGINSLSVSGTSVINNNITTTATSGNGQYYGGSVTLANNITFTGGAGSTVYFNSTVNGQSGNRSLTVVTANAYFNDTVGGTATTDRFIASVTVGGSTTINANITATGNQAYNGAAALGSSLHTLTSTGGNVSINGIASGTAGVNISAASGITMNNSGNTLSGNISLTNNTSNNINIRTSGDITISAINNAASGNININNTNGSIVIPASPDPAVSTNTINGVVSVEANGNININGNINCNRLELTAGSNVSPGALTLNGNLTASRSSGETDHELNAAIYIRTGVFNGNGGINPQNGWACAYVNASLGYTGTVLGNRIHYHTDRHIVYKQGAESSPGSGYLNIGGTSETIAPNSYLYIQAGSIPGDNYHLFTAGNSNIYFIDAGTAGRNITAETANGDIVMNGIYSPGSGKTLELIPGGAGKAVRFANCALTLDTFDLQKNNITLVLRGSSESITASNIKLGNVLAENTNGNTAFNGDVDITGSFTFNGANLTMNGNVLIRGVTTINRGVFALNGSSTANINFQGNFSSSAAAKLIGSTATPAPDIRFGGNVILGLLEINNNRIIFNNSANHDFSMISSTVQILNDVLIEHGNTVNALSGTTVRQADGSTLDIERGAGLSVNNASWHIGASGTETGNNFTGYNGTLILGEGAKLSAGNVNLTGDGSPESFIVENSRDSEINATGNVVIGGALSGNPVDPDDSDYYVDPSSSFKFGLGAGNISSNLPKLIISMSGNGSLTAGQPIGRLHINKNAEITLKSKLILRGGIKIDENGCLDSGGNNITLYAGLDDSAKGKAGRWEIIKGRHDIDDVYYTSVTNYSMSDKAFRQAEGSWVAFKKEPEEKNAPYFEIIGNSLWRQFICHEPGAVIQFSQHPDQHVFLDLFDIKGKEGDNVTLTRLGAPWVYPDPANPGKVPPNASGGAADDRLPKIPSSRDLKNEPEREKEKFWNFNIVIPGESGAQKVRIEYVTLYFSHAWNQRIPIDVDRMHLNAIPFYRDAGTGYFNYDWIQIRKIIYSFIEDSNGNGKADRIRAQTNISLNGDFRQFKVEVEDYEVDTSRGQTAEGDIRPSGYDLVYNKTNDIDDMFSFYIYLKEKPYPYDGKSLKWWVTENESLKDSIFHEMLVGIPVKGDPEDEIFNTINTIPPRVSYALTIPGHDRMYVRMSQPVSAGGGNIRGGRINAQPLPPLAKEIDDTLASSNFKLEYYYLFNTNPVLYDLKDEIPTGVLSYLVPLNSTPSLSGMAQSPPVGNGTFGLEYFIFDDLVNLGVRALDWNDEKIDETAYLYYKPPRYPVNLNYTAYKSYNGNSHVLQELTQDKDSKDDIFLPPYKLLSPEMARRLQQYAEGKSTTPVAPDDFNKANDTDKSRRITDLLVSRTPSGDDPENYFAWPVWAKHKENVNLNPGGVFFEESDHGIILIFDGTKYLEDKEEITLQARINKNKLKEFNSLSLFYGYDVPVEWREPAEKGERGKGSGGLWLPQDSGNIAPLFYPVPSRNTGSADKGLLTFYSAKKSDVVSADPLFTFGIKKPDAGVSNSGVKVDFLLRLEGGSGVDPNLYIARLAAAAGADLNTLEWWKLIRPFSFDIQNIRLQRGGVTILNNVINSNAKENVYIRYNLVRPGRVTIQVFTLDGTLVKSLRRNEQREAGVYTDAWNGTNNAGRSVARGMYFIKVTGPDIDEIRKILVIKK